MNKKYLGWFFSLSSVFLCSCALATHTTGKSSYDYYLRGLLFEKEGNWIKAQEEYEMALNGEPSSPFLHRTLASLALRMGSVGRAVEEIDRAVALLPRDHDTRILASEVYFTKGDLTRAREHLEKALEINPESEEALLNLAYLSSLKEPHRALDYYKKYLSLHPGSPHVHERLALLYQQMGENEEAVRAWHRVVSGNPESLKAQLSLGQLYEVKGDTQTAFGFFEQARRINPRNLPLLLHLGQLYYKLGRSSEAFSAFEEAEKIAPDNLAANFWLALMNEDAKNWSQASAHMERVSRVLPEPGILLRLSYYQVQQGNMKASLRVLKRLRDVDPSNSDYIYYEALGYEQSGQLRQASKLLDEFLALKSSDAAAHFQLGTVLDRLGRFEESAPHLLKAIELRPDYDMALNYLGYSWAERGIKLKDAEVLITRALRVDPANPAYKDSLGWVHYQQGRYPESERELAQALLVAQDALIEEHWADALWKLGDKVKALEVWQAASDLGDDEPRVRGKIAMARKEVNPFDQARLALKRAYTAWAGVKNFSGLAKVSIEIGGRKVRWIVRVDYLRNESFRFEPLEPGAAGYLLWEKGQWINALPNFSGVDGSLQKAAARVQDFMSGKLLQAFLNDPHPGVQLSSRKGKLVSGDRKIDMNLDRSEVMGVEWLQRGPDQESAATLTLKYRPRDRRGFPTELSYEDPQIGFKVKLSFVRVLLNVGLSKGP